MAQGEYRIRIKGKLNGDWTEWFDGWTVTAKEDGTTIVSKEGADQSALHGVIVKIRNLNLSLISVNYIDKKGKKSSVI